MPVNITVVFLLMRPQMNNIPDKSIKMRKERGILLTVLLSE